jgi:hypothetical protein
MAWVRDNPNLFTNELQPGNEGGLRKWPEATVGAPMYMLVTFDTMYPTHNTGMLITAAVTKVEEI